MKRARSSSKAITCPKAHQGRAWRAVEALTTARYFHDGQGQPGFRSGDWGRINTDGILEFLGRRDTRVKIHGSSVELDEVEQALCRLAGVERAIVCAFEGMHGTQLTAYVVLHGGRALSAPALRRTARGFLPEHMVPSVFQIIDDLPLMPHGKVDRHKLLQSFPPAARQSSGTAFETETEAVLAVIWSEAINIPSVSRDDNFFELGGDSLLASLIAARVASTLNVQVPIRALFESPGVSALAKRLEGARAARVPLVAMQRPAEIPLSFAQRRLWFLDRLQGPSATYAAPAAMRLAGVLNRDALEAALGDLVARHEVLRTIYPDTMGVPRQVILAASSARPPLDVVSGMTEDALAQAMASAVRRGFELARELPLRAHLFALGESEHVLLLVLHHIACDGWSMPVLRRDLACAYAARCQGSLPDLCPLPVQYADYTLWQQKVLGQESDSQSAVARQLAFWVATLKDLPESDRSADRSTAAFGCKPSRRKHSAAAKF